MLVKRVGRIVHKASSEAPPDCSSDTRVEGAVSKHSRIRGGYFSTVTVGHIT